MQTRSLMSTQWAIVTAQAVAQVRRPVLPRPSVAPAKIWPSPNTTMMTLWPSNRRKYTHLFVIQFIGDSLNWTECACVWTFSCTRSVKFRLFRGSGARWLWKCKSSANSNNNKTFIFSLLLILSVSVWEQKFCVLSVWWLNHHAHKDGSLPYDSFDPIQVGEDTCVNSACTIIGRFTAPLSERCDAGYWVNARIVGMIYLKWAARVSLRMHTITM